jgi:NADH-quinone oxidoreductase subunit A
MLADYLPVLILFALALGLGLAVLALTFLIGPRNPSPVKDDTYESGLTPIGPGRRRVPVRYYLIATLFILFDIEVIYLFPWAARFRALAAPAAEGGMGLAALGGMSIFMTVLVVGFVYVWRAGALEWE